MSLWRVYRINFTEHKNILLFFPLFAFTYPCEPLCFTHPHSWHSLLSIHFQFYSFYTLYGIYTQMCTIYYQTMICRNRTTCGNKDSGLHKGGQEKKSVGLGTGSIKSSCTDKGAGYGGKAHHTFTEPTRVHWTYKGLSGRHLGNNFCAALSSMMKLKVLA